MQITDVRIRQVAKEGKMKAVVSITLDNEFVVHDIKVIDGDKGLFIAMPSRKTGEGEYRDIAHPINSSTRDASERVSISSRTLFDAATFSCEGVITILSESFLNDDGRLRKRTDKSTVFVI